jgi:hypothetical protein
VRRLIRRAGGWLRRFGRAGRPKSRLRAYRVLLDLLAASQSEPTGRLQSCRKQVFGLSRSQTGGEHVIREGEER